MAHLADDPETAERVQLWSKQNEALRAAYSDIVGEPVPVWLRLGHLPSEQNGPVGDKIPPLRRDDGKIAQMPPSGAVRRRMDRVKVVAAAAVLVAAGALSAVAAHRVLLSFHPVGQETKGSTAPDNALVSRGIDAFRTFALDPVHPVEIASTQQVQLEHWLFRRLSVPLHAPDLRQEGWSFLGGRLAPGDIGPGAFLVYENDVGDRMGLYIARTGATPRTTAQISSMPGGATLSWVSGPVGFVLMVGKDEEWLARGTDRLRARIQAAVVDG